VLFVVGAIAFALLGALFVADQLPLGFPVLAHVCV
jgi:hypothetical protein